MNYQNLFKNHDKIMREKLTIPYQFCAARIFFLHIKSIKKIVETYISRTHCCKIQTNKNGRNYLSDKHKKDNSMNN